MFGLTDTQKELLELEQYSDNGATCLAADFFVHGKVNKEKALACMYEIFEKNDIFHMEILQENGEPVWNYNEKIDYEKHCDAREFSDDESYHAWVEERIGNVPSALESLYSFTIVCCEEKIGFFMLINHIIADAWTMSKIGENFAKSYQAAIKGEDYEISLNSYIGFMEEARNYIGCERYQKDAEYWKEQIAKCSDLVVLTNHPSVSMKSARMETEISLECSRVIADFCKKTDISEYVLYMAALGAAFHSWTGADQFYIGSTVLNRTGRLSKNTLGLFANTVPIYISFDKTENLFSSYISNIKETVYSIFRHQKYTYNRILKDNNISKIFDVSLNFQSASILDDLSQDMTLYPTLLQVESLIVHVLQSTEHQYRILFDYQRDSFDAWEMKALQQHMLNFIENLIAIWEVAGEETLDIPMDRISLLKDSEREDVITNFNRTRVEVNGLTIDRMFEEQVMCHPAKTAIILKNEKISYETLNRRANYVATELIKKGIGQGDFVAINAGKKIETVVAILGVLKSGAAFVPIDPEYPQDRIHYILKDCQPAAILVGPEDKLFATKISQIVLRNGECGGITEQTHTAEDVAYMIYTSGTTGRPKGVVVEHHGVESLRSYFQKERGVSDQDVVMQFASFSFDAAISEITMSLLCGGTMCIVTEDIRNDVEMLEEYLETNHVSAGIFPPQYLTQLHKLPFRLLLTAGSESNHGIIEKFAGSLTYSNDYGPTEGTVCATAWKYEGGPIPRHIPIGRPIANKQIYILRGEEVCGIGEPGELCIAGDGIARGYFHQDALTQEKFVKNPFGAGRMYRSGDMARWTMDGNVEFLGRIDNQVKIRGFRIEVAEIESVMRNVAGVSGAAVVIMTNELQNEKYLNAYYTADEGLTYEALLGEMRDKLPNYMIPSYVYQVTEIPLNRNGKVDTHELKKFIIERSKENSLPENETEGKVLRVFQEVIGCDNLGMEDNFFERGGDSIKAIGIVSKLKTLQIFVSVKDIIQSSTIREFCKGISKVKSETDNSNGDFENADAESAAEVSQISHLKNWAKKTFDEKMLPLTDIQKEVYLGTSLDDQGIAYNVPLVVRFSKKLDRDRLRKAVNELQKRHISIRSGFSNSENGLVQFYRKPEEMEIEESKSDSVEIAFREFLKPFDLEKDRLLRMKLVVVDDVDYLMFDSHHIVVDGLSMNVLFDELIYLYQGGNLPKKELDFNDYIVWNTGSESAEINVKDLNYWEKVFAEGVEKTLVPTDYERNGKVTSEGETIYREISGDLYQAISDFCVQNKVTPFMLLMSVYGVLVHKLAQTDEVIVGVPTSGRFLAETETMVGMFVSSLPFKMNIDTAAPFIKLVKNTGDNLMEILQHQNCTMNQIASRLGISSENGQNPFFSTMFGVNDVVSNQNTRSIDYELVNFEQNQAKFDITLDANREADHWQLVLRYNRNLYKPQKMKRFMDEYETILRQVLVNSKLLVREIGILSKEEENKLLFQNNNNKIDFPQKNSNVVKLFHEQALKTPKNPAVAFDGRYLTYAELDLFSSVLAAELEEKGICKGKVQPILTERSMEMLIMELAIMKTGAGFCPMDPAWPKERKEMIKTRLGAEEILAGPGCYDAELPHMDIRLEEIRDKITEKVAGNVKIYDGTDINGADTFYVIYTSGSTGEPKGVVVPYRGIINRFMWMNQTLGMKACSSVLLTTNYVYDSSIWQFYWPLINGGKSVIPRPQDMLTADFLLDIIEREEVGIVDFVPSVFNTIVEGMENSAEDNRESSLRSLVWVVLGGEEIKPKAVNRFLTLFPHMKCINLYGPTEASIGCIYKALSGNKNKTIPIGKPIFNVDILILDKDMNLVPEGICGEIYIGGICLADGYFGDSERTVQNFISNPFPQIRGERLYKTGDIAKWDEHGDIYYLGRSDSQVKIRGFRIELQEIEAKILNRADVKECVVLAIERRKDDKVLCAYFAGDVEETELKNYLTAQLPGYMVPSYYVKLDKIPIGASGKANRKMLPKPDFSAKKHGIKAPANETEKTLLEIWSSVLKMDEISTDDNYFEIGGDSIKALQMVSMLRKKNIEFTMQQLFANPTICQLAKIVGNGTKNETVEKIADFSGELELSPIQKRFFTYYDAQKYFNQAVLLKNENGWDAELLENALWEVVCKHPMLRAEFKQKYTAGIIQNIRSIEESNRAKLAKVNIDNLAKGEHLEDVIPKLQAQIDVFSKLYGCTLICEYEEGKAKHLFLTFHHLIVDAVSMRILVKDLVTGYMALEKGEKASEVIGSEEYTYQNYIAELKKASGEYHFRKQDAYWNLIQEKRSSGDTRGRKRTSFRINETTAFGARKNVSITLNKNLTAALETKANHPYGTRTEELLLTAFLSALSTSKLVTGENVVVDMESMGRNIGKNEMKFAETVGWFTALYPVCFPIAQDLCEQVIGVKEAIRSVPDKGVGYQFREDGKNSAFCFNYLGDLSVARIEDGISLCEISNKTMIHPDMEMPYAMDISASIKEKQLTVSFDYVPGVFSEEAIKCFTSEFKKSCMDMAKTLCDRVEIVKTPADFGRSAFDATSGQPELSMEELKNIIEAAGRNIEKIYPLTATQTGMLFHTIAEGGNGAYFEQNYLTLKGDIVFENLKKAYEELIRRTDIFRTVFLYDKLHVSYQVVKSMDVMEILFTKEDLTGKSSTQQKKIIDAYCREDKEQGFDIQQGPLMRVKAFQLAQDTWKLVWSDHHILMDGMCLAMIMDKITSYYQQLCEGREIAEEDIAQYGDYISWLQEQDNEEAAEYWKNEVISYEKTKELYKGGDSRDSGREEYKLTLLVELAEKLKKVAADNGVTLNAVMQAAWAVMLMRYMDSKDVLYGSVMNGRSVPVAGVENMIGLFISTLPIRVQAAENESFISMAKQIQTKCAGAESYSYYPLSEIQKYSEYGRQLFDHIFVFENFDFLNTEGDEKSTDAGSEHRFRIKEASAKESTNYDLTVVVVPRNEILISFIYKKSTFDDAFMQQMMRHYVNVLEQAAENCQMLVDEIEVLDESDYREINVEEAFQVEFPDVAITEIFRKQVEKFPDRIAIQFENETYTYREVDEMANRIANTLLQNGIQQENIIGILMEKSARAIISALGILKAGGAYMPLDPSYPAERLEFMIADSHAPIVITDGDLFGVKKSEQVRIVDLGSDLIGNADAPNVAVSPENLAYIIYTSGTTGKPKGAMIFHRNVVRLFLNDKCLYDFTEKDVWVMFHSFCFDFSVWEMYGALLFGGRLIIITKDFARDTFKFMKLLETEKVTVLNQTPSAFNSLSLQLEMEPEVELSVRYIIFGGEKLHPAVMKYFHSRFKDCRIINMYGITETTVHVTYKEITNKEIAENVSDIGVPIPTLGLALVDSRMKPVPRGMQGEIVVWGHGVCRGYLGREELTAAKFLKYKHGGREFTVYRSGDAGRYITGGLEYIGRIDQQVKIRGHRIELGEIKNSILKNEKMEDAVIVVSADAEDNRSIIAYFQPKQGVAVDANEVRNFVGEHLPSYMVPTYFIPIDKIPLNVNGKLDKKALPKPEIKADMSRFAKPETDTEKYIANVWEEVLEYSPVGLDDNYFEIGGDSIKVIKILSHVHADGYHFEVADLFAHPTIREFTAYLKENRNRYEQSMVEGDLQLTPIQEELAGDQAALTDQYNQAVMLYSEDELQVDALRKALVKLLVHHDALRSVFVQEDEKNLLRIRALSEVKNADEIRVEDLRTEKYKNENLGRKTDIKENEAVGLRNWQGEIVDDNESYSVVLNRKIEEICTQEQERITLSSDKLFRLTLIRSDEGDYLFFAIHHMVVDVVSWNIIAEDLTKLYQGEVTHENVKLGDKTMSVKEWSKLLHSDALRKEARACSEQIWKELARDNELDVFQADGEMENAGNIYGTFADTRSLEFDINAADVEKLKKEAFRVLDATMEETLLSVTARAVAQTTGRKRLAFAMESTGRFAKDQKVDLTRTVGWFTSVYPLVVNTDQAAAEILAEVKEKRRSVKNLEYTFGICTGLENAAKYVKPQISFNYLGHIQASANGFVQADMPIGPTVGRNITRSYAVDISCKLVDTADGTKLHFTIAYSGKLVGTAFAGLLMENIQNNVLDVTKELSMKEKKLFTPADFDLDISIEDMEYLQAMYGKHAERFLKMTPMQKGMLYHVMSHPEDDAYYEKLVMHIHGEFSLKMLADALSLAAKNHATLRTAFVSENISDPVQIILKDKEMYVELADVRGALESEIEKLRKEFDKKPFAPAKGELSKFLLLQIEDEEYEIIWEFHHLILDGWSVSLVLEEIFGNYTALCKKDMNAVISVDRENIADGAEELYAHIGRQSSYQAKNFWKEYLEGREVNTQIPFEGNAEVEAQKKAKANKEGREDHTAKNTEKAVDVESKANTEDSFEKEGENKELDFYLDEEYTKKLKDMTMQNVTTASVVLTAWGVLLQMTADSDEAVFGSVVSGRNVQKGDVNSADVNSAFTSSAIGMFINTIPICTSLQGEDTFIDAARRLQEDMVKMEQYSYYPLYEIQSDMNQGNPVISHVVAYENYPVNEVLKQGLENGEESSFAVQDVKLKEHTNYSIGVVFTPGKRLKLALSYNEAAFYTKDVQKIAGMYFQILRQIIDDPQIKRRDLKLLTKEQENELVQNYAKRAWKPLMVQVEKSELMHKDKLAVQDEENSLTYDELRRISNGLANILMEKKIKPDETVALMCGAGVYQAVGILGIMKANAVYLPVDTSLPLERIRYMLQNSGAKCIICDAEKEAFAAQFDLLLEVMNLDKKSDNHPEAAGENAYIIYTSGTTGNPKGVLVGKDNIAAAIGWRSEKYGFTDKDAILQLFAYSFDGFMTSFFTPLVSGAKIVFVKDVLDIKHIGKVIESEKITHFISVPMLCQSIFENLGKEQLATLRIVTTAGDRLGEQTYEVVKKKNPEVELVNEYGPTECTVVSTIKRNVTPMSIHENSIGSVIENGYIYIVDQNMHLLPSGLEGEIVVGGQGVSRGYIGALDLTNRSFVADPYRPGEVVYRTGDKGRLLSNGEIGFLGRVDKQVKIRGYRIETLEIETLMEEMEHIESAAAAIRKDRLVAYYVGDEVEENIRRVLSSRLPKYMMPSVFVKLTEMPLSRIGKVDYKKLPEPVMIKSEITAPSTDAEREIWSIWEKVLGHSDFGVTDNFFEVGGNSIRLMNVYGQLNKLYPEIFTVASLFSFTTVRDICEHLVKESEELFPDVEKEMADSTDEKMTEDSILAALDDDDIDLDDLISKL